MNYTKLRRNWFAVITIFALSLCLPIASTAQVPMPQAITINPADASGTDTVTLTLDIRKICTSEKSLPFTGQETLYMSGGFVNHWGNRSELWSPVNHADAGRDGTPGTMTYNGDSTYSIRFQPDGFFDPGGKEMKAMLLDFADLNQQRQAYDFTPFGCARFYVPLKTTPPTMDTVTVGETIEIGGLIVQDAELDFDTVRIVNHLSLELGSTLTISPGTYVEFQNDFRVNIFGTLKAEGTSTDSIIFAAKDPATGWQGFFFYYQSDMDTSRFDYCHLKHMRTDHDWEGVINPKFYPRLSISHSIISNNFAHAINLVNSNISLDHSTLSDNEKGGVSSYASDASFLNCRIINNNSHGMYINLSNPLIVNTIISNNTRHAVELHAGDPVFINSILAKNGEKAMWLEISNPKFYNSIIWGNRWFTDVTDPSTTLVFQNCIFPSYLTDGGLELPVEYRPGNIVGNEGNADPKFIDPPADTGMSVQAMTADWRSHISSVAVNSGTLNIDEYTLPAIDFEGKNRVLYGIVDIGPHEFSQSAATLTLDTDVTSDTILMADTVKVTNDIKVHDGAKLTIAPGTIVEFQGYYELTVEGCLIAKGSEISKIRFTIFDSAGYYDLDTTLGSWNGLHFQTWENPTSVLEHCIFEFTKDIKDDNHSGGAVFISDKSSPQSITNCLFENNYANWQGGAISVGWAGTEIENCEFRYNTATEGGAIYTSPTSSAKIRNNYIHNNQAWTWGGGIYTSGATVVERNRIAYNTSYGQGGGIYIRKSTAKVLANIIHNNRFGGLAGKNCDPLIFGNLIVNNSADAGLGAWDITREGSGIFLDINSDAIIANNTIANNLSSQFKGSVVRLYSNTKFMNNIVWGNMDDFQNPAPIAIEGAINVNILNCILEGGTGSIRAESSEYSGTISGILDSLPQFLKASSGIGSNFDGSEADWSVNALSPAINNGLYTQDISQGYLFNTLSGSGLPEELDIGAFEHQTGKLEMFSQPVDIVSCDGDTVAFDVMANDTAYYQWYLNEEKLEGATQPLLEMKNVEKENEGIYFCRVWNAYGQKISEPSFLIINHPPELFIQPDNSWMIEGTPVILEARAEGTPPMHFQWYKDGIPIPEAIQPKLISQAGPEKEGLFHCTIENFCGTVSTDTIQLYLAPQICMVTVDTSTGDNLVIWEKKTNAPVASYNVYRESIVRGQYEVLANVAVDSLSVFTDTTANPAEQAYIYKITALDAEGNESDINLCKPHKTIHLLTSFNTESLTAQLDWDEYYGFGYGTYFIYRSASKTGFSKVKDISSSFKTWLDTDAEPNTRYYYRVAVARDEACNPTVNGKKAGTGPYQHALSNLDDNKLKEEEDTTGTDTTNTSVWNLQAGEEAFIWPNPMTELSRVRFTNPESEEHTLYIRDLSGKLVRILYGIRTDEVEIRRNNLKPGYYSIEISGPKIYRGKLIIK